MFKFKTSTAIKEAMLKVSGYKMQQDPDTWNESIQEQLINAFPFLADMITGIKWDDEHSNYDVGFGLGEVTVKSGDNIIQFPFIVKNYELSPFDMYVYKEVYYPAKKEALESILFNPSIGEPGPKERFPIPIVPYRRDDTGSLLQQMLVRQNYARRMKVAETVKRLKKDGYNKLASMLEEKEVKDAALADSSIVVKLANDRSSVEMRLYHKGSLKKITRYSLTKFASKYGTTYKKMMLSDGHIVRAHAVPKYNISTYKSEPVVEDRLAKMASGSYRFTIGSKTKTAHLIKTSTAFPQHKALRNILVFSNHNYLDSQDGDGLYTDNYEKIANNTTGGMTVGDIDKKTIGKFIFCPEKDKCFGPAVPTEIYDRFAGGGRYIQMQFVMAGNYYNIIFSPHVDKIIEMDRADKGYWVRGAKNYLAPLSTIIYPIRDKQALPGAPLLDATTKMAEMRHDGYIDVNRLGDGVYQAHISDGQVFYYKTAVDVYGGLNSLGYPIRYKDIENAHTARFYYDEITIKQASYQIVNAKRYENMVSVIQKKAMSLYKLAEEIDDNELSENVIGLSLIDRQDVEVFIDAIPALEETMSKLTKLLYYVRLGLKDINQKALENAVDSLYIVIEDLKGLAADIKTV